MFWNFTKLYKLTCKTIRTCCLNHYDRCDHEYRLSLVQLMHSNVTRTEYNFTFVCAGPPKHGFVHRVRMFSKYLKAGKAFIATVETACGTCRKFLPKIHDKL